MIDVRMYVQISGSVNKVCTGVECASYYSCLKRICSFKICTPYVHLDLQFCNKPLEDGRIDRCI